MKKLIYSSLVIFSVIAISSCKKCASCVGTDEFTGETLTSDFCGKGNVYKDELEYHERNEWTCTED